jgi:hypothetical protein
MVMGRKRWYMRCERQGLVADGQGLSEKLRLSPSGALGRIYVRLHDSGCMISKFTDDASMSRMKL